MNLRQTLFAPRRPEVHDSDSNEPIYVVEPEAHAVTFETGVQLRIAAALERIADAVGSRP